MWGTAAFGCPSGEARLLFAVSVPSLRGVVLGAAAFQAERRIFCEPESAEIKPEIHRERGYLPISQDHRIVVP
jgi:hypothetical protein